ncbi:MAG TPA: hypothetical protein VJU61_20570 [Polyangiaceae bacterium]|nr:hypothetical protein [Polyangiaceae bacterium]
MEQPAPAPDRLSGEERLPEAETAFGLALPRGLRLKQAFNDSAHFAGKLPPSAVVEQLGSQLVPSRLELMGMRSVFARVQIKGDTQKRWFRIEVSPMSGGSRLHIQDLTPARVPEGLSPEEMWKLAGRTPDGKPVDENQLY